LRTFAVLIPAYNEELVLAGTVGALIESGFDPRDVYLVDDRSTDNTAELGERLGINVFTVPENGGKALAVKRGLEHFELCERYSWVIFLDGDTKADRGFHRALCEAVKEQPKVGLFVGQVMSVPNDHIYSASRAVEYVFGHDVVKQGQSNFNCVYVAPGCASIYRADVLAKLEISADTLAEDMDLTLQVHRLGLPVVYVAKAIVHTQDPASFQDYHKQVLRWCRGVWQVIRKHKILWFTRKQRVDWYMLLILLDAIAFNKAFWVVGLSTATPELLPTLLLLDLGISFLIASYAARRTRRWDLIYKFPLYFWISYVNLYAFLRSFTEVMVLRRTSFGWNKVKRYDFSAAS
jgi:cellulose synthase/poly-beta-1,6-N-acetylglucosamine synthase-like glycosyltransferase